MIISAAEKLQDRSVCTSSKQNSNLGKTNKIKNKQRKRPTKAKNDITYVYDFFTPRPSKAEPD